MAAPKGSDRASSDWASKTSIRRMEDLDAAVATETADATASAAAAAADAAAAAADAAAMAAGHRPPTEEEKQRWAQEERERTALLLSVLVRDRRTGRPVAGAVVQRGKTDASGLYQVRRPMPEEGETIDVYCPMREVFGRRSRQIASMPFQVRNGRADALIEADISSCAEPAIKKQRRRFAGVYTWGFEQSTFVPCEGMPTEAAYYEFPGFYWVDMPHAIGEALRRASPTASDGWESRRVYVDWVGTSTGPGSYGHMGAALYQLDVDALYKVSPVVPVSCNPPGLEQFPVPPPPPEDAEPSSARSL